MRNISPKAKEVRKNYYERHGHKRNQNKIRSLARATCRNHRAIQNWEKGTNSCKKEAGLSPASFKHKFNTETLSYNNF